MSWLSKVFGGGAKASPEVAATEYQGFRITPQPMSEDGGFRLAALIEKDVGGEAKSHHLIRADVVRDHDEAVEAAIAKAKQMIDQMGERLFN